MAFLCPILILGLCFQQVKSVDVASGGLWSQYRVHSQTYDAQITQSDAVGSAIDWHKMNEACKNDVCLLYHKHCAAFDGVWRCDYVFGAVEGTNVRSVQIEAKDAAAFGTAEELIGVPEKNGLSAAVLPLSAFAQTSPEPTAPVCSPFARILDCARGRSATEKQR